MRLSMYNDILSSIREHRGLSKDCTQMLKEKYKDIPVNTLYSILSIEIQQKMRINHRKLFDNCHYYESYLKSLKKQEPIGILLRMAVKIDAPPALLARHILEKYCICENLNVSKSCIGKLIKDTTLIENKDLAYEIYLCVLYDDFYGPISDAIGHSIGQEYELKLENHLIKRNLSFRNENQLRSRGYDKTPDVKLEVPIAVNGFVINWIESKARFGSTEIHQKNLKEQFLSYWNRFGPGLVIYWYGFLDTLHQHSGKKFIIMDHFPQEITYMDPDIVKSSLS